MALFLFTEHRFVNRGIYEGPYLPIYGVGGLLLCLLLRAAQKKPMWVFLWWDYSGHFMNIHGRVCLLGVTAFGAGGTFLICLVLPWYERIYGKIPEKYRNLLCVILTVIFVADGAWCAMHPNVGNGISF